VFVVDVHDAFSCVVVRRQHVRRSCAPGSTFVGRRGREERELCAISKGMLATRTVDPPTSIGCPSLNAHSETGVGEALVV
jgi:hypothetical protein